MTDIRLNRNSIPTTLAEIFAQAADLIELEGSWCKGVFGKKNGIPVRDDNTAGCEQRCLVGAVRFVCESSKKTRKLRGPAEAFMSRRLNCAPMNWNDLHTQKEVVEFLRMCSLEASSLDRTKGV